MQDANENLDCDTSLSLDCVWTKTRLCVNLIHDVCFSDFNDKFVVTLTSFIGTMTSV